ncbi:MAG: pilin [Clostridia bacterium]|nr:pilin [Clostridia bacterium]
MKEMRTGKLIKMLVVILTIFAISQVMCTKTFATNEEDSIKAVQNAGNTIGGATSGIVNQIPVEEQSAGTSTGTTGTTTGGTSSNGQSTKTTETQALKKSEAKGMNDVLKAASAWINGAEKTNNTEVEDFVTQFVGIGQILVTIAIVVLLIVIGITGIRWITASPEKQAKLKEQLIGLVVATVVIFGAVGIWNLVRGIMKKVEGDYLTTANQNIIIVADKNK